MSTAPTPNKRLLALIEGPKKKIIIKPFQAQPSLAWILNHTRWTYYAARGKAFCYNTTPIPRPSTETTYQLTGKYRRWAAWQCRVNYDKNLWTPLGKPQFFALRKSADKKAYSWYTKAANKRKEREATASTPSWRNENELHLQTEAKTTNDLSTMPPQRGQAIAEW